MYISYEENVFIVTRWMGIQSPSIPESSMGVHASRPVLDSPEVLEAIYTFI
jgi:hypothetical protein